MAVDYPVTTESTIAPSGISGFHISVLLNGLIELFSEDTMAVDYPVTTESTIAPSGISGFHISVLLNGLITLTGISLWTWAGFYSSGLLIVTGAFMVNTPLMLTGTIAIAGTSLINFALQKTGSLLMAGKSLIGVGFKTSGYLTLLSSMIIDLQSGYHTRRNLILNGNSLYFIQRYKFIKIILKLFSTIRLTLRKLGWH